MEIPVYLFTGFLEAGKTRFLKEALTKQPFGERGNVLLLVLEDGEEEYDKAELRSHRVFLEYLEDESELTADRLINLMKKHDAVTLMVEYNGMWQLGSFYNNLPDDWFVYQEMFVCDSKTAENYNKNMRSLVVDKLQSCDLVVFNRVDGGTDKEALHKLVRGVSRNADIVYDMIDGTIEYDDIEDPLPFDINAETIKIDDTAFAYWYRDIAAEPEKYDGKKIKYKGVVVNDEDIPKGSFICGRPIMTCCADDIRYSGLACKWKQSETLRSGEWVELTGKIVIEAHKVYASPGPVIHITSVVPAAAPEEPVAMFN